MITQTTFFSTRTFPVFIAAIALVAISCSESNHRGPILTDISSESAEKTKQIEVFEREPEQEGLQREQTPEEAKAAAIAAELAEKKKKAEAAKKAATAKNTSANGIKTPTAAEKRLLLSKYEAEISSNNTKEVEILWQIPRENVQSYTIFYGFFKDSLDKKKKLPVSKLEKRIHPKHGDLYRYLIMSVPDSAEVYFSLQAKSRSGVSPKSKVLKALTE